MRSFVRKPEPTPVDILVSNFFDHFAVSVAVSDTARRHCFRARHQVYCEELGYEAVNQDGLETDEYDAYSVSCYITHIASGECAGTIRVVLPRDDDALLPLEQNCKAAIAGADNAPSQHRRKDIAEVSRLAVPKRFRRVFRPSTALDSNDIPSAGQASSLLSVALYLMATSICLNNKVKHAYVMMEPRLARSMSFIGIRFRQLGSTMDYHGKRAAYSIVPDQLVSDISPTMRVFQQRLLKQMTQSETARIVIRDGSRHAA
ncbi:PEP-CTERM/exosortase system-associated acyltransferase [Alteromonas sp. CYL-A6]|uniref:PEP-CTERM/exosortase system-associated acyltransferase n=1 Tax=Alteromonas nitratireducens TaxID=3390813 RepID=UPI0034B3B808